MLVDTLIRQAAELSGITTASIYGPTHKRKVCAVRCAVYTVARDSLSMTEIGRQIDRHHTTIMNALDQADVYRKLYPKMDRLIHSMRTGERTDCRFVPLPPRPKRSPIPRWTDEQFEKMDRLIHAGVYIFDIADELGKSYEAVKDARRRWLKKHPDRKVGRSYPADKVSRAVELRLQGLLYKDIGDAIGVCDAHARNYVRSARPDLVRHYAAVQSRPRSIPQSGSDRLARQCHPA